MVEHCGITGQTPNENQQGVISNEEMDLMRKSVTEGVEKNVKPFLERVEKQSHIKVPRGLRIKQAA